MFSHFKYHWKYRTACFTIIIVRTCLYRIRHPFYYTQIWKTDIFKKLQNSIILKNIADAFHKGNRSPDDTGNRSINFCETPHSLIDRLTLIRKKKYGKMIMTSSRIEPSLSPPSSTAAFFYDLRVYHQLKVWQHLLNSDMESLKRGLQMKANFFIPILTDEKPGLQYFLRVRRCNCTELCDKWWSYRKAGLKHSVSCKECLEKTCSNSINKLLECAIENSEDNDRHFLDTFSYILHSRYLRCILGNITVYLKEIIFAGTNVWKTSVKE